MPTISASKLYRMEFTAHELLDMLKQKTEFESGEPLPLTARVRTDLVDRDPYDFILTLEWETD